MGRRISFDVDDTLICYGPDTPREPNRVPWILRPLFREPLRWGSVSLMRQLVREGWEICIYTTSHRSPAYLRWLLRFHGIRVRTVVNQYGHKRMLAQHGLRARPSKFPRAFGIDLHVDDSEGVAEEGRVFGFQVVVVSPDDRRWTERVIEAARRMRGQ